MSKTKTKTTADTRTEFKLAKRASIIVSSNSHTICGIRTFTMGSNEETIIVSSNPACHFGENISTIFLTAALDRDEEYRSAFVELLNYIDFGKDMTALFAVSSVSNFPLQGTVKDKVTEILGNYHLPRQIFGKSTSKGA